MYYVWIVCKDHCKDLYLPDSSIWNGEIRLNRTETGCNLDLNIPIRALDGEWYINCPPEFTWENGKTKRGEVKIFDKLGLVMCRENDRIGLSFSAYDIRDTVFSKYLLPKSGRIEIGRNSTCGICFSDRSVSHIHGVIDVMNGECRYTDSSSLGSYINGVRLKDYYRLRFGDTIMLPSGVKLVYLRDILAVNSKSKTLHINLTPAILSVPEAEDEEETPSVITYHHRTLRIVERANETPVAIEPPPNKTERQQQPAWLSLGPSMTMVLPMAVGVFATGRAASSLVMIGTSSMLAVFWGIMNNRYRKKEEINTEKKRTELYKQYITEMNEQLAGLYAKEFDRLLLHYPDIGQCSLFANDSRLRLWERMPTHPDFLHIRLGKGNVPLPGSITTQQQRLSLVGDPLRDEAQKLIDRYSQISDAPIILPLRDHLMVGVWGSQNAIAFTQGVVLQLAALHSYHDMKVCILSDESQRSEWEWARWLPHVFASEDRLLRMVAYTATARQDVLAHLDEVLSMRMTSAAEKHTAEKDETICEAMLPHYVVVCTNPEFLDGKPLLHDLLSSQTGFTVLLLAKSPELLLKECSIVLDIDDKSMTTIDGISTKVDFEYPHHELLRSFAKKLAPIRVKAALEDAAIPSLVTFLEIYGVRNVDKLDVWRFWNENKAYEGLKSIIGLSAGSQPFILDISDKAHGPHGLIAGTTGSGKSVMLETYILSLAVNYHPDQIRFILIDYKGGGMADTFRQLPHVTGIIDNLQGERIISRALSSIQGELHRRELIFKEAGVNNIDDYIRFFGDDPAEEKLPHLIIIVDEFAELKNEQPDFMQELVSASRIGRSLGVHLILATQKPSNSVSDEIWANTNFRICLRVQSRSDSMDMLHRPDAAYIKGMGRCFIQVGNDEIFEQVQTSYSGAPYKPNEPSMDEKPLMLDDAGQTIHIKSQKKKSNQRDYTQMNAVLDLISKTVKEHKLAERHMLWLDELKAMLHRHEIPDDPQNEYKAGQWPERQEGVTFPFAIADDVANQRYLPVWADLTASRNLMVVGIAGTGKTTVVQTMIAAVAYRYDPAHVHIYVFSLSSRTLGCLSAFPHVGEIVYENEVHETRRVLNMLSDEAEARGKLFQSAWTNNFLEYNRSQQMKHLPGQPAIVVFIDRMAQIKEMLEDDEKTLNLLYTLIREGSSRGIFFVVTSMGGNEIPIKLRDCFSGVALQLRERSDYSDIIGKRIPLGMPPIAPFPGRGMYLVDDEPYEIQVALPANAPRDIERAQILTQLGKEMSDAWKGKAAPGIARIPEKPAFSDFAETTVYQELLTQPLCFPLAYDMDSGLPLCVNLQSHYSFLITGGRKSGKTNALMHIARSFTDRKADIFVLGGDEWQPFCKENGATMLRLKTPEWDAFVKSLITDYGKPRSEQKRTAQNKDQLMQITASFKPFVLLIDNLDAYMDPGRNGFSDQESKLLSFLVSDAAGSAMYTFASVSSANLRLRALQAPLKPLIDQQRGIVLGGKLGDIDPWNLSLPYREKNAVLPVGTAVYVNDDQYKHIVFPLLIEA